MKKLALLVAAVAMAVVMTGCVCTSKVSGDSFGFEASMDSVRVGRVGGGSWYTFGLGRWFSSEKSVCEEKIDCCRAKRFHCPVCGQKAPHFGICPKVSLFEK